MNADDPDDQGLPILTLLERAVRRLQADLVHGLAAAGVSPITPAHTTVLAHLDDDAAVSVAELARRAGVTRQTMHRAVAQLIDEGLLTSRLGAGFPRSTLIEYSDTGRSRRAVAMKVLRHIDDALSQRLGPVEVQRLRAVLAES